MLRPPPDDGHRIRSIFVTMVILVVWAIGLASAIYLIYNALYLLCLAIVFGFNAPPTPVLGYIEFVGKNAIPAVCFVVIGLVGFLLWPSERFWVIGLLAVMVETVLAIFDIANPESMLILELVPK